MCFERILLATSNLSYQFKCFRPSRTYNDQQRLFKRGRMPYTPTVTPFFPNVGANRVRPKCNPSEHLYPMMSEEPDIAHPTFNYKQLSRSFLILSSSSLFKNSLPVEESS